MRKLASVCGDGEAARQPAKGDCACDVPFASDLADKLQTGKIGCLKQLAENGLGKHLILVKRPLRQCWPIAWIQDQILPKVCALVAA